MHIRAIFAGQCSSSLSDAIVDVLSQREPHRKRLDHAFAVKARSLLRYSPPSNSPSLHSRLEPFTSTPPLLHNRLKEEIPPPSPRLRQTDDITPIMPDRPQRSAPSSTPHQPTLPPKPSLSVSPKSRQINLDLVPKRSLAARTLQPSGLPVRSRIRVHHTSHQSTQPPHHQYRPQRLSSALNPSHSPHSPLHNK
jgi:hypothetical protein